MSKKIAHADLPNIGPEELVNILNTGGTILNATFPFIKDLFSKIKELVQSVQTDKLSTPHGKRVAIEQLREEQDISNAKDAIQKELNKLYDGYFAQLKEKGIIE